MEIGVFTNPFTDNSLEETLEYLHGIGVTAVELGSGGGPGDDLIPKERYLDQPEKQAELRELLDSYGMSISAFATHNNPLHPDESIATAADHDLRDSIRYASQMDVDTVTCFSGLPAGSPNDETPNWVTVPWPTDRIDVLEYQWEDVAIPYWRELAAFADEHDVDIAIEMHPNFLVYEPQGLLHLREETNERIGANFDPSHLVWQGINIRKAIRQIGKENAIHHVHAKDARMYDEVIEEKGVLDTVPYTDESDRSWLFRTIGYGHDEEFWRDFLSTLRMVGYDGAISIEHEDSLTSSKEGIEKAVDLLQSVYFETEPGEAHWMRESV